MIIFPAIDIKDGKVVRLLQGQFDKVTEYANDPVAVAKQWEAKGAQWLHVVDLDGALQGVPKNRKNILKIAENVRIPVQTGGGIRSVEAVAQLIEGGVARVVLGTKVIEDRAFLKTVLQKWPEKITVSLDCSKGMVAQRGWTVTSNIKATDLVKELEFLGLSCIIYTDIARDGMLTGPNYTELELILKSTKMATIVSGGIASLDDIKKLKKYAGHGLLGVITGKAIYEGKLDLEEALKYAN